MQHPDLLIHIGHGKTGSTSIQRTLDANRPLLAAAGVVFGDADGHANHQQIFAHLTGLTKENLPGYVDPAEELKKARGDGARLWAALEARIAQAQPRLVVLSCENQFRTYPDAAFERMNGLLRPRFGDIRVMAYLRGPASYFLSAVQQDLKKRPEFVLPSASRFRDALEPWAEKGPGRIALRRFARDALAEGDVVTDFIAQYLPMTDPAAYRRVADDENETVSAEAMEVLQQYFRGQIKAPHRHYDRRPQRYKWLVRHADAAVPGQAKPRLLPGLREVIEARCTDLDWLADRFGLRFPEIGQPAMPREEAERAHAALRDVADICTVDAGRKQALLDEIARIARAETAPLARLRRVLRKS
ncbi:hypothetical protein M4578_18715 [Salipiger sp. P9]|uniref:hypothetical protein n=1 Tax=Salipiger pentaromativorans TaxID=2943193 RepID=UPI0021576A63|nr:hypothetical protein [Salipiger pentaromativorans]MCR8549866.1 hypothetical protein [Salipiger pentaromativorans]